MFSDLSNKDPQGNILITISFVFFFLNCLIRIIFFIEPFQIQNKGLVFLYIQGKSSF